MSARLRAMPASVPGWGPIGLAAGILLLRLPTLSEPGWSSDDGFFTAVAMSMAKGRVLYAGIYDNQPPVIYWLYRLLIAGGLLQHHLVVQLVATAAVIAAAVLTHGIARRAGAGEVALWAGGLAGLALSLPTLDGDLMNVELAALPFFLGALLLAFSGRPGRLLAAGALLGLALATRPSFAVDSLALAVPLLGGGDVLRRTSLVAGGVVAATGAVAAALWLGGSLWAYLGVVLPSDHAYLVWANGGSLVPLYTRLGLLAVACLAVLTRCRTPAARLAAVWVCAALAGSSLTPRELSHYAQEAIPALAFGIALLAARLGLRVAAIPLSVVAVVVAADLSLSLPGAQTAQQTGTTAPRLIHNFSYPALPAYYGNWLAYVGGSRSEAAYDARFPGRAGDDATEASWLRSLAGSRPIRLIVLGDRPWLFIRSGALPAGRFLATNTAFWRVAGAPDELDSQLRNGCADLVVYASGPGDWTGALEAGGYQPAGAAPWPTYRAGSPPSC